MEIRYEKKWRLNKIYFNQLINSLKNSNFKFFSQYKPRWVNSIYFDDKFFSSIKQNLDGNSKKKKLRIRWYGEEDKINNFFFEIKLKKGLTTYKKKNEFKFENKKLNNEFLEYTENKILNKFPFLFRYNPVAKIKYQRFYFVSKDKKVRATIDCQISYQKINNYNFEIEIIRDQNIVLEFKYNIIYDEYVRSNLENNFLRLTKNSKYINAFYKNYL